VEGWGRIDGEATGIVHDDPEQTARMEPDLPRE
jgi:hypothetical protein